MFGVPRSFTVPVVVSYKAWYNRPKTFLLFGKKVYILDFAENPQTISNKSLNDSKRDIVVDMFPYGL